MTPLHWFVATNNPDGLKAILKHTKFDLNVQAKSNGKTPLILAVQQNSLPCVNILLEVGADPNGNDEGFS
jgi:ankyrin repeat protein